MERRHLACLAAAGLLVCWIVQLVLRRKRPDLLALSLSDAAETIEPPSLALRRGLPPLARSARRTVRKRFEAGRLKLLDRELQEEAGRHGAKINRRRGRGGSGEARRSWASGGVLRRGDGFGSEERGGSRGQVGRGEASGDVMAEHGHVANEGFFSLDRYRAHRRNVVALRVFLWIVMLLVLPSRSST